MAAIRYELIRAVSNKAYALTDYDNDMDKHHEFRKKTILVDKSLTKNEKSEAIRTLNGDHDYNKILYNKGKKRFCKSCRQECLATFYCENCLQNYLKAKFSSWTSGNGDIDDLIQKCQSETPHPQMIVEWIPYNNLQNMKYLTRGGCSEIYSAEWIEGPCLKWNIKEEKLERIGTQEVILKKLENVESANRNWFDEAKSHLNISSKCAEIVLCYGLAQDSLNKEYFLVMRRMDTNLRNYLQQNNDQLTWKERIHIIKDIIDALSWIHEENAIHRDLHSGNILYSQRNNRWHISDLGFCGPADKPLGSVYGNLPYIAPEVIDGKEFNFASDIYSICILMWEISSEQPPFNNYENDYDLAIKVINGMRPKIVPDTPLEYRNLMEQCWDAVPTKRPNVDMLTNKIREINKSYYPNESNKNKNIMKSFFKNLKLSKSEANNSLKIDKICSIETNNTSSKLFTSKIYKFKENLPEPRNATEEEQEAFHSKPSSFSIPDNVNELNNNSTSRASNIFKDHSKRLSKVFKRLQIYSKNDNQNDYMKEVMTQEQIKGKNINIDDEDEIYNNPNLHSEEQDELEIPDDVL